MNLYEVTLFETIQKTLVYEIKARGEKEAKRKAKRLYKFEDADEQWTTSYSISEDAIVLLTENNVSAEDDDECKGKPKKKQKKFNHVVCPAYPNCDEDPMGCRLECGDNVEEYGMRD